MCRFSLAEEIRRRFNDWLRPVSFFGLRLYLPVLSAMRAGHCWSRARLTSRCFLKMIVEGKHPNHHHQPLSSIIIIIPLVGSSVISISINIIITMVIIIWVPFPCCRAVCLFKLLSWLMASVCGITCTVTSNITLAGTTSSRLRDNCCW